nr:hypothetical protein CFP56_52740 [Quercus suber]
MSRLRPAVDFNGCEFVGVVLYCAVKNMGVRRAALGHSLHRSPIGQNTRTAGFAMNSNNRDDTPPTRRVLESAPTDSLTQIPPPEDRPPRYPTWYFFYGTLLRPEVLRRILDLPEEPSYRPAHIVGFELSKWGQYLTLIDGPRDNEVAGAAYLVESEEHANKLARYETDAYTCSAYGNEIIRMEIGLEEGGGLETLMRFTRKLMETGSWFANRSEADLLAWDTAGKSQHQHRCDSMERVVARMRIVTYTGLRGITDMERLTGREPIVTREQHGFDVELRDGRAGVGDTHLRVAATAECVIDDVSSLRVPNQDQLRMWATMSEVGDLRGQISNSRTYAGHEGGEFLLLESRYLRLSWDGKSTWRAAVMARHSSGDSADQRQLKPTCNLGKEHDARTMS